MCSEHSNGDVMPMVIALGIRTEHWRALIRKFPCVLNCSVDVREALHKEWDASHEGSGFDEHIRRRMKQKPTWTIVESVAMWILASFGLLLVVCKYGKHRSLSVGYEIAKVADCELVSPRDRIQSVGLEGVDHFLARVDARIRAHIKYFGEFNHPIEKIGICNADFDGPAWMNSPGE